MDPIISTSRLKLTLVTRAERGSPELRWCHDLRSNEKVAWWSIYGQSKSITDTERFMKSCLPTDQGEQKTYRVVYAVHHFLGPTSGSIGWEAQPAEQMGKATEFVGLITLVSLDDRSLALPEDLTLPTTAAATTLTVELAYNFLPIAWGRGYATESIKAVFESCRKTPSFWSPFSKLYVRAIVNEANPASQRVMDKTGITRRGVYNWTGEAVFIAGEWRQRDTLFIFGMYLVE